MIDAAVPIMASFLDRHGVTAEDAAEMTPQQFATTANLCRLQETPDQRAVVASLRGRQMRRDLNRQDFRARLAQLERNTR